MISFSAITPSFLRHQSPSSSGVSRPSGCAEPVSLDQVSLGPLEAIKEEPISPKGGPPLAKLKESGVTTTLQALPREARSAQLLTQEGSPMNEQQRSACIADLETLNLSGQIRHHHPETFEVIPCGVAAALESVAKGHPIYYRQGREGPVEKLQGLEMLAATAHQAQMGRVGY